MQIYTKSECSQEGSRHCVYWI